MNNALQVNLEHKSLSATDLEVVGKEIVTNLLTNYDAVTSFVMVKQLLTSLEMALDFLKTQAIVGVSGNDCTILGAELKTSTRKTWKYNSFTLDLLMNDEKELKEKIKKYKKVLELCGENGFVNTISGDIETAVIEKEQTILTTTFKK